MATVVQRPARRTHETPASSLVIRNIVVAGHRTSVRLEPVMWDALQDIARQLRMTVHDLVTAIDRDRTASSLTAAIRVYIVDFYRTAAMHAARDLKTIDPPGLPN
jgi:predicted DNA-binding ribbon-helix-helix protein